MHQGRVGLTPRGATFNHICGSLDGPEGFWGSAAHLESCGIECHKNFEAKRKTLHAKPCRSFLSWALIDDAGRDLAQDCRISPSMSAAGAEGDILGVQGATGEFAWHVWSTGRARIDVEVKS